MQFRVSKLQNPTLGAVLDMRVFVTGATGVLGRWVVRLLVEAEEVVRCLSRSQENASTLRAIGAEPVEADLFHREILYRAMVGDAADCAAEHRDHVLLL